MKFSWLVIIDDFDLMCAIRFPEKADSPLLVDSNAVLALALSPQRFETICRRDAQVFQCVGNVQLQQFAIGDRLHCIRQFAGIFALKHFPGFLTAEALNHNHTVYVLRNYVKRNYSVRSCFHRLIVEMPPALGGWRRDV